MQMVGLLDCTLRDGGYVNNWMFGASVITQVCRKSILAGMDVVELGYLSTKNSGSPDCARYSSLHDVRRAYCEGKNNTQRYAVMINYGEYPIGQIETAEPDDPVIRVAFHKKDMKAAIDYIRILQQKGHKCFVQPMGALDYSDADYLELVGMVNEVEPEAFYLVDSFGVIEMTDFRRLLFLTDNNLKKTIVMGYHAHNNLQQAYSNAKFMVEQHLSHNLIIDTSVFGMGRGAGNLNSELFARYLNQEHNKHYNIEPILELYDECLKPIYAQSPWGYSLPFYLSSIHNCHPNYASFFADKNTLSVKSMHELLSSIKDADKISFSKEKAAEYYNRYQENYIDDRNDVEQFRQAIDQRPILVLAPGKSIVSYQDKVKEFVKKQKPVVIGVNRASEIYEYDYLFVASEKRLEEKPGNVKSFIKTSNLHKVLSDTIQVNYSSYLSSNPEISDNPTLMLLNLFVSMGIKEVSVAGFDGFSLVPEDNYFAKGLSMGSSIASKVEKNAQLSKEVQLLRNKIDICFLTPSLYI